MLGPWNFPSHPWRSVGAAAPVIWTRYGRCGPRICEQAKLPGFPRREGNWKIFGRSPRPERAGGDVRNVACPLVSRAGLLIECVNAVTREVRGCHAPGTGLQRASAGRAREWSGGVNHKCTAAMRLVHCCEVTGPVLRSDWSPAAKPLVMYCDATGQGL